jgi:Domain of unknown function (DUF4265)
MKIVAHVSPVWAEQSDCTVVIPLWEDGVLQLKEEIPCVKLSDGFLVCCVPFFIYGVGLGDVILDSSGGDSLKQSWHVVKQSSYRCVRVWLKQCADRSTALAAISKWITTYDVVQEQYSDNLLAFAWNTTGRLDDPALGLEDFAVRFGVIWEAVDAVA